MPSAEFHSILISDIIVDRNSRQRKELGDTSDLEESIKRVGLIHPILVRRDTLELVVGERRLTAVKNLGWTNIPVQFEDEVDPLELKAIEFEENIRRKSLPWVEEVNAVEDYHKLKKKLDQSWTMDKTAEALGITRAEVVEKIKVSEEVKTNPKLATLDNFSSARNIVRRVNQRRADMEAELANNFIKTSVTTKPKLILNESFLEWAPLYDGPKFNLIHCDFPYGINADKINQGTARIELDEYSDSGDIYWELLNTFAKYLDNFCADSAHLIFWFSMKFYTETISFLRDNTNFIIDDFPLIWIKSDNKGLLPDPQRGPRRIYETALFGRRGDRKIVAAVANSIASPSASDLHMSQKPQPVITHFFRMLVDETTTMLDPTCGSGTAVAVAKAMKAKTVLGLEINPEFAQRANSLVEKT